MRTHYNFSRLWNVIKRTGLRRAVLDERELPLAHDLSRFLGLRGFARSAREILDMPYARTLCGSAGYGYESRRWLDNVEGGTVPVVTTGANTLNYNVLDFIKILSIGFCWQTAGTVTRLVADFDAYPAPGATGSVTDKLDGTNGFVQTATATAIATGQAISAVLYKDIGHTLEINRNPATSIQFIVTTTTTAGDGVPFIIVIPQSAVYTDLGATVAFASA